MYIVQLQVPSGPGEGSEIKVSSGWVEPGTSAGIIPDTEPDYGLRISAALEAARQQLLMSVPMNRQNKIVGVPSIPRINGSRLP